MCVCGVWSVLCFNFVTAQKYIGLEGQVKELNEEKDRMTLVCAVCVRCVCGVCAVCVRCVCGVCAVCVWCVCGVCVVCVRCVCGVCVVRAV